MCELTSRMEEMIFAVMHDEGEEKMSPAQVKPKHTLNEAPMANSTSPIAEEGHLLLELRASAVMVSQ